MHEDLRSRRLIHPRHPAGHSHARRELTVMLEDRPAIDTGVQYCVSDLATMTKRDLVGVLNSMGQTVHKRRPTRLELLGGVITFLCDMGRLRL